MEAIHLSDIHLGVTTHGKVDPETGMNTQVLDFLDSLDMVCDYIEEVQADIVLFSGDAYHYHSPSPTYISMLAERVRRISNTCPIVLIPGNHDMAASRDASAVDVFGRMDVENVYTTDEPKSFLISTKGGNAYVACMPWPTRRRYVTAQEVRGLSNLDAKVLYMDRVAESIRSMASVPLEADFAVLMAHLTVAGCVYGSEQKIALGIDAEVLYEHVALPEFDYVALGHIHHFQDISKKDDPPVVYAGNLDRISFLDEGQPKGFVHISINDDVSYKFIDIDARPMRTIRANLEGKRNAHASIVKQLEKMDFQGDEIVRLILDVDHTTSVNDVELVNSLSKRVWAVAGISKNVKRTKVPRLADFDAASSSEQDTLRRYFQEQGENDINELLQLFEELTEDAE